MQGKTVNGYTLQRLLGVGGMAEVWYAENEIGKPAAVKILSQSLSGNAQIVERFHNEALVMVKLNHPNIRQVYGYGYIDDRHCIIMEYLEGSDLETLLKQGRRFTDEELRRWWNQIAHALNYTHSMGIVHRDIKPSNLFLDNWGNIKLLDFGIAKIKESISLTHTGAVMGTLMYMSPEQVKDSKYIDYHTDIYSLAVTFAHLLTGRAPYDSNTSSNFEIQLNIVTKPLEMDGMPATWYNFLTPYLEKEPGNRPELRAFDGQAPSRHDEATFVDVRQATPQEAKPEQTSSELPSHAESTEPSKKSFIQRAWPWAVAFVVFEILYWIMLPREFGNGLAYGLVVSWPFIIVFALLFWLIKYIFKDFKALPWVVVGLSTVGYLMMWIAGSFNYYILYPRYFPLWAALLSLAALFVFRPKKFKALPWVVVACMGIVFFFWYGSYNTRLVADYWRMERMTVYGYDYSIMEIGDYWLSFFRGDPFWGGYAIGPGNMIRSLWWFGKLNPYLIEYTTIPYCIITALPVVAFASKQIVESIQKKKQNNLK